MDFVCTISDQFNDEKVKCSNSILQNETNEDKLVSDCGYHLECKKGGKTSFLKNPQPILFWFSNEELKGELPSGEMAIQAKLPTLQQNRHEEIDSWKSNKNLKH